MRKKMKIKINVSFFPVSVESSRQFDPEQSQLASYDRECSDNSRV